MSNPTVLGVIPARYGSRRFPGKPLADILGRPMIEWVREAATEAESLDRVIVATDDQRIYDTVESAGGEARMTSEDCASGSDRVAEVLEEETSDYVVNIQGDEPLIRGEDLDRGIEKICSNSEIPVASFMAPCPDDEVDNNDVVKVVVDNQDRALYFSRSPIPYNRDQEPDYFQHVGIYIYRSDYLTAYRGWERTPLERAESLEQLRVLEHGDSIVMSRLSQPTIGVDRPEDIAPVEARLRQRSK